MRILITLPWGERLGGAEKQLQLILEGARGAGHEIEPVFLQDGSWPQELREAGLHVEVIDAGRLRAAHRYLLTVARLSRILRRRRPDLIVNWAAKTQLYGAPAAVLAGMAERVAWWQHAIPPRSSLLDRCATLLPAAAIGCCSQAAAAGQARISPQRRTFVVVPGAAAPSRDGEPSHQATREEPPAEQEAPVLGLVGRLQPGKGQDRLLRAQAILRERGHRTRSIIVGGDAYGLSPRYASSLPALIGRLDLEDAVRMTGQVEDVEPYLEQMDILVNATEQEAFGIVLLEAMARGVAVVAVGCGGPVEFIEHGRTGMLARSGAPEDLADAIEPLISSSHLRAEVARRGRALYLREFTEVALRGRFFAALEKLSQGGGGARGGPPAGRPEPPQR